MQKRDWATAVPIALIYGISFLLVERYGIAGIYFWAGGLALWVIIAGTLRTSNARTILLNVKPSGFNRQHRIKIKEEKRQ